jgi:hypothetical protein
MIIERCKQWYDQQGGPQIWRLLERQKSQQNNLPASPTDVSRWEL